MTHTSSSLPSRLRTRLRRRRALGKLFAFLSAVALALGLLVMATLIVSTLAQSGRLVAMHATAEAGLSLSTRSLSLDSGGGGSASYVTISQVEEGSQAEAMGMHPGDALIAVDEEPVESPSDVWRVIEGARGRELLVSWVPGADRLLGDLKAARIPGEIGKYRAELVEVQPGSPAARAGLRAGDVLISAKELPITGTRQAWQAIVVATQRAGGPFSLTIERDDQEQSVHIDAGREAKLTLDGSLRGALWSFVTTLNEPRYPEHAGLLSAVLGSIYVILVTAIVAFPLGTGAAIYLEEYAPRNPLTETLQILIANLAGVPSVVYGIIGLELLARAAHLGRSILAGGMTLGLLILPIMIIAAREALRAVPPWVREAAYSVGATRWQMVRHHVLPYALPGILTGMILALSRAIGEAAPLILLGAFLYVTYAPSSLMDSFTVIPLQIFDWATRPQDGFLTVAAVAIIVLLAILLLLNGLAIGLRNRYQRRW